MPGKERSNLLLAILLVVIAAGQAINVTALKNNAPVNVTTTVLDKTSIDINNFSIVVDGSVVDFF